MRNLIFVMLALVCLGLQAQSPEVLTLDACISTALERNIEVQMAKNNAQIARSNKVRAMMSFMPNLQAQWNYNLLFGTFWDNVAARQVTQQRSSNPNVSSSVGLFQGMSRINDIKRSTYAEQAATQGIESTKLNAKTNVLSAFLATALDKENIKISEERIALLEQQLEREVKRESVGVGNMETVYNFRSQVANERLTLTNLRNQYRSDLLRLVQLLRGDVGKEYVIEDVAVSEEQLSVGMASFQEVLSESFAYAPAVKSAEAARMASIHEYKSSRANVLPSVNLYGELGSRYSSQGAANPNNDLIPEKAPYFDQMNWNQYEFISLSVNVPIFSRYQNSNVIQNAKLNMLNAELAEEQARQQFTNAVQQVYLDLVASQENYRTAVENLEALEQSFDFVKKRYETGNTDFYTYMESLNNKNRAELQLANARLSIVFRKKILDLYKGE
ncbi:TolC family protein [Marinoscillum furvescens]|nr:TolC family protein [Marinoscillum furvescens]